MKKAYSPPMASARLEATAMSNFQSLQRQELAQAKLKHPPLKSAHEGYAVILEELDEVWAHVKTKQPDYRAMRRELIQVAAMAQRMAEEICDREISKPFAP